MAERADEFNLIAADLGLFFQLPKGAVEWAGIFFFQVSTRKRHLVAPGVAFTVGFLNRQYVRIFSVKQQQKNAGGSKWIWFRRPRHIIIVDNILQ